MTQHTKEPWEAYLAGDNGDTYVGAKGDLIVCEKATEPDAKRIVAAVNACAGMADPEAEITQLRQDKANLLETLEEIINMRPKSMLEDCAYQGPPTKKWLNETAPYYEGYNKALDEFKKIAEAAITKAIPEEGPGAS